ncbi:type I restriction-modification enzyme R subunit C-terminal domain-containing protein [Pseudonocardia sp. GCM10023141]|uniref:type I restriction-modification enzyme R subunit C-terminal domain-containing protein n=1 Tax=Pseudonocardia sp. GCM10023141 TaxID=3252653 RepID=UPI00361E62A4
MSVVGAGASDQVRSSAGYTRTVVSARASWWGADAPAVSVAELERIFIESGIGTEDGIDQAKANAGGLGMFIRSLVGLDREATAAASATFQQRKTLTSAQLCFVNEVIDYLAHNGTITIDVLYRSSFSSIAPGGPEDLPRRRRDGHHDALDQRNRPACVTEPGWDRQLCQRRAT